MIIFFPLNLTHTAQRFSYSAPCAFSLINFRAKGEIKFPKDSPSRVPKIYEPKFGKSTTSFELHYLLLSFKHILPSTKSRYRISLKAMVEVSEL